MLGKVGLNYCQQNRPSFGISLSKKGEVENFLQENKLTIKTAPLKGKWFSYIEDNDTQIMAMIKKEKGASIENFSISGNTEIKSKNNLIKKLPDKGTIIIPDRYYFDGGDHIVERKIDYSF